MLNELAPELPTAMRGHLVAARLPDLRTVVYLGAGDEPGALTWTDLLERATASRSPS